MFYSFRVVHRSMFMCSFLFSPNISCNHYGAYGGEHRPIIPLPSPQKSSDSCKSLQTIIYLILTVISSWTFQSCFSKIILWLQMESWVKISNETVYRQRPSVLFSFASSEHEFIHPTALLLSLLAKLY